MQPDVQKEGFGEEKEWNETVPLSPESIKKTAISMSNIAGQKTQDAKNKVYRAIAALNEVKGLQEHVGVVQAEKYQSVFEGITETINNLSLQMESSAKDLWKEQTKKRAEIELHHHLLEILEEKRQKIEKQREYQRKLELLLALVKSSIEQEERQQARIKQLEEMIRRQVEEDIRKEAEETRRKHEFSTESLLSGDYFSFLDQIEEQEKKKEENPQEVAKIGFLQNALSRAVTEGLGSEKYGEREYYGENS